MTEKKNGQIVITLEEALKLLPEKEDIHTFMNPAAGMLLGADWSRDDVVKALALSKEIHLTGEAAQAMDHGLAIFRGDGATVFIETRKKS